MPVLWESEGNGMATYVMTRRCVTGANEYRFFKETTPVGSAAAQVCPDYPTYLRWDGEQLLCNWDPEITLVSGIRMPIYREANGTLWGSVVWEGWGAHRIQMPQAEVTVRQQDKFYRFYRDDREVAVLRPAEPGEVSITEWEKRLVLTVKDPLPDGLALPMLAFPLLQLGP